ncbi:hypothetical protein P3S67_023194 [Capsicum chacoense]
MFENSKNYLYLLLLLCLSVFLGDKLGSSNELGLSFTEQDDGMREPAQPFKRPMIDNHQSNREIAMAEVENNVNNNVKIENELIDLNSRP